MTDHALNPTLALSVDTIIYLVFIVIAVIGSLIGNQAKEAKEAKAARERRRKAKEEAARRAAQEQGGEPSTGVPTLDQIARRRREQLEALAKQRRGEQGGQSDQRGQGQPARASAGISPTSVTRANVGGETLRDQRAEAERAREASLYEQRREHEAARHGGSSRQRETEIRLRQDALQTRRADADQAARGLRPSQPQRPAPPQRPGQAPTARPGAQRAQPGGRQQPDATKRSLEETAISDENSPLVGRDDLETIEVVPTGPALQLDRQTLRDAIIMKEILDRPLGIRGPGESDDPLGI